MPTPAENHELVNCFACGTDNPEGLHLRFRFEDGRATAETTCRSEWRSWRGLVHGSILIAFMDEAMGWAVAHDGWTGLTGRLSARLLRPVAPGQRLRVQAWVKAYRRGVAQMAAELTTPAGVRLARAEGLLMVMKDLPEVRVLA